MLIVYVNDTVITHDDPDEKNSTTRLLGHEIWYKWFRSFEVFLTYWVVKVKVRGHIVAVEVNLGLAHSSM